MRKLAQSSHWIDSETAQASKSATPFQPLHDRRTGILPVSIFAPPNASRSGPDLARRGNNFPLSHWMGFAQKWVGMARLRRPRRVQRRNGIYSKGGFAQFSAR